MHFIIQFHFQALSLNGKRLNESSVVVVPLRRGETPKPEKYFRDAVTLKIEPLPEHVTKARLEDLSKPFGRCCLKMGENEAYLTYQDGYSALEAMHELNNVSCQGVLLKIQKWDKE